MAKHLFARTNIESWGVDLKPSTIIFHPVLQFLSFTLPLAWFFKTNI